MEVPKFRNQKSDYKIYGFKENDSEIDFEEEPRTALMASQNNEETYQENDDNYLCRNCEERRSIENKEIETLKSQGKTKEKEKQQLMSWGFRKGLCIEKNQNILICKYKTSKSINSTIQIYLQEFMKFQ
jgi:hypothetical protein